MRQPTPLTPLGPPHYSNSGPWEITIDGLVDNPLTIDVKDLIDMFHLEQRTYAHRTRSALARDLHRWLEVTQ